MRLPALIPIGVGCLFACHAGPNAPPRAEQTQRLPTGAVLDPAGAQFDLGSFPLALVTARAGHQAVLLLNGYREQGVQVFDLDAHRVVQTLDQPASFLGLTFDHAGDHFYASGGNQDLIYRYHWQAGRTALQDSLVLAPGMGKPQGRRYPAGLAVSPDDRWLLVCENLGDSLALLDLRTGRLQQRVGTGRYPYGVVINSSGQVFVSSWVGQSVGAFQLDGDSLVRTGTIPVGRHPSAMVLNAQGTRLFVASASTDRVTVVDTRAGRSIAELRDTVPGGLAEGSTPNALQLSPDGRRLYVAEADNNAVAIFELGSTTAGIGSGEPTKDRLLGRVPVGWYPTALAMTGETLLVVNGKGRGTAPNGVNGPGRPSSNDSGYTLGQINGTLSILTSTELASGRLAEATARVARANGWATRPTPSGYPPFTHVIYVIKENRTFDQILGDLPIGDADTTLVYFPRGVTPNHHALAERFGVFDRFFVNAEVSADGHNWSVGAYATDYVEKTTPSNYSGRGRSYDYEGENRDARPPDGDDVAEPAAGYLWDLAKRRGLSFRNFGEFVRREDGHERGVPEAYLGLKPFLEAHTDSAFPGFDLDIPDQKRADLWLAALARWSRDGSMPALQILRLPNDHTMGGRAGSLSPRAYLADNDLALGRVIEGLSRSPFWRNTVVFVVEDDAQDGPDHVDSHRAPFLLISAWNKPGVYHRFTNTTDVMATIEDILALDHLSQFDAYGRPLHGLFAARPDTTPYLALTPSASREERNPARGAAARESRTFNFRYEDQVDDDRFNRVLWLAIKGSKPYPGSHERSLLAWRRGE